MIYILIHWSKKRKLLLMMQKAEVIKALSILGDEYVGLLNEAFDNKWIDVYAKKIIKEVVHIV